MNQTVVSFTTASLNLALDVAIFLLPIPVVWGLQMVTSRKIAVTAIFGMGLLQVSSFGGPQIPTDFCLTAFASSRACA